MRASILHLTHTLHFDVEEAAAILDVNFSRRTLDACVTDEYLVLGGPTPFSPSSAGRSWPCASHATIGAFRVPWYTLLPAVEELRRDLIAQGRNLPGPAADPRQLAAEARAGLRSLRTGANGS